jgi:Uma2 family endonuclease
VATEQKIWTDEEFMALPRDGDRYVLVYHSPEPDRLLRPQDQLEGEDVVPGFAIAVAELFEEWDF